MIAYEWVLAGAQIVMTVVVVIMYLRLHSRVQNLAEDVQYYRWFNRALTLLVQEKQLTGQMQQAVEAETKVAQKIVGGD